MRDEFTEDVKRAVAQRVAYFCSRPDCRAQTTGPQVDSSKAVSVGVAAHITAASAGGPRYDPTLLLEERKGPSNAIWLCQNCAKLVDNDPIQFPTELLRDWKRTAEEEARDRVGKTQTDQSKVLPEIKTGRRVMIRPIIPHICESQQFVIESVERDYFQVLSPSDYHIRIPTSAVQKIQSLGDALPPWILLDGRLQWKTRSGTWAFIPEQPPLGPFEQYGAPRKVWMLDPAITEATNGLETKWASEQNVGRCLSEGWAIFYGEDGSYLRNPDRSGDLILICKRT